eukprot:208086-Hanusia_phi.AAC.1
MSRTPTSEPGSDRRAAAQLGARPFAQLAAPGTAASGKTESKLDCSISPVTTGRGSGRVSPQTRPAVRPARRNSNL